MQNNNIEMVLDFKRESDIELDLPFQTMLQIVNNLVHNSIKCLEGMENKTVYLNGAIDDNILTIIVADNGKIIPNEDISKIFEYGFSTTGGSGIGLYHANYICQQFNGQISIETDESEEYTKAFVIKLPIKKNGEDNINN
jgi:sensor histidine kinase regulating citrate/malate metabolism